MKTHRKSALLVLPLFVALLAASLGAPAQAGAVPGSGMQGRVVGAATDPCPTAVPVGEVHAGMQGEGLTVVRGSTPQPFNVEVLGVLPGALGPGRDLIIVEVSDVPGGHVIDQGGGIWAGMSGSPVYLGDQLLGAVAYGFTASPSPIGGVTPAADMYPLLSLPTTGENSDAPQPTPAAQEPGRIAVPGEMSARIAATGARAGTTLERLPLPLSVSGLESARLARLQADADAVGLHIIVHPGGRATPTDTTAEIAQPRPGGNFASVLSYGDFSAAGVGTTTAVCADQALAFGHPMQLAGASTYGANDANSLTIVRDNVFGSFKMANPTATVGVVDQDRPAGLRAQLGAAPVTTPVTSTIDAVDIGRSRTGTTQVAAQAFLPTVALFGTFGAYDSVFEEIGDGTASNAWTITGTRAGGEPFSLSRANQWASLTDVVADPSFDFAFTVDGLLHNKFEPVTIDNVSYTSSVSSTVRRLEVVDALLSVNGGPYERSDSVDVTAGALLRVRAVLQPYGGGDQSTVVLPLRVPAGTNGRVGTLTLFGGPNTQSSNQTACLLSPAGCTATAPANSLDDYLTGIGNALRNDDLSVTLTLNPPQGTGAPATVTTTQPQDHVVTGQRTLSINVLP